MSEPASTPITDRRRWLRFSLRTLLLFVLLVASSFSLWQSWEPWKLEHVLSGHSDSVRCAAFSPDGRYAATASWDCTARLWECGSGTEVGIIDGHGKRLAFVAFHNDVLMTSGDEGKFTFWHVPDRKKLSEFECWANWHFNAAFSPDGKRIVASSISGKAPVFDAATGKELMILEGHTLGIKHAEFSTDGRRIVTGSNDGTARVWDAESGKELLVLDKYHNESTLNPAVNCARFSQDGKRVITSYEDNEARIWDSETGKELTILHGDWGGGMAYASFSPDGNLVITAEGWEAQTVWEWKTQTRLRTLNGHNGAVHTAVFSPDGSRVITASDDKTAQIWLRCHPESRFGIAYVSAFWLTIVLACAVLWSLWKDRAAI